MTHAEQITELTVLLNRAKRAGIKAHHYPENHLIVLRVLPESEQPPPAPVVTQATLPTAE
jgi:hypothetical protein